MKPFGGIKIISAILTLLMLISFSSYALSEKQELPEPLIENEILFNDFTWYSDYATVYQHAKEFFHFDYSMDSFKPDYYSTPHWNYAYSRFDAGMEKKCGGSFSIHNYSDKNLSVAGYDVEEIEFFFMWDLNSGLYDNYNGNYKENGSALFYMASYELDVNDTDSVYADLKQKLSSIYSTAYYTISTRGTEKATIWVNKDYGVICLGIGDNVGRSIRIVYYAPHAEERLMEVEKAVSDKQATDASGNLSGL